MTDISNILPIEVLLQIFKYCSVQELFRLKQTCKKFCTIIETYKIITADQHTIVTNQIKTSIKNRSILLLNPFEKWRISYNWRIARYKKIKVLNTKTRFMPWLYLDNQYFWISQGKYVKCFRRKQGNSVIEEKPKIILNNSSNEDIVRFRIKGEYLICGLRGGNVWIWSLKEQKFILNNLNCHQNFDINDVDIRQNLFITAASDSCFSIWPLNFENVNQFQPLKTRNVNDKIWSIEMSPNNQFLAVGSAGYDGILPFHIYDLERQLSVLPLRESYLNGAGTLDIHWEDNNIVLSCGYDTYLRKWDVRTGQVVQRWEEPHDSSMYCIASDDLYTVIIGSNSYGRAVLFDQRVSDEDVQIYYGRTSKSSPVYSLSFDASQLFLALDLNVTCLDFSVPTAEAKNHNYRFTGLF